MARADPRPPSEQPVIRIVRLDLDIAISRVISREWKKNSPGIQEIYNSIKKLLENSEQEVARQL
jgi:hypothetical protein